MTLLLAFLLVMSNTVDGPKSPYVDWLGPKGANGPIETEVEDDEDIDNSSFDPYIDCVVVGFNEADRMDVI